MAKSWFVALPDNWLGFWPLLFASNPDFRYRERLTVCVDATHRMIQLSFRPGPHHVICRVLARWIEACKAEGIVVPFDLRDFQFRAIFAIPSCHRESAPFDGHLVHHRRGSADIGFLFPRADKRMQVGNV